MRIFREQTAVAAISELRTKLDAILRQIKETSVLLEKHNKPVAVMVDPTKYERMQEAIETASDLLLAFEARRRESSRKERDYIPLAEAQRRAL